MADCFFYVVGRLPVFSIFFEDLLLLIIWVNFIGDD